MTATEKLSAGLSGTKSMDVSQDKTAPVVGSGSVDVFATPMLVAVMEAAACDAIDRHLPDTHTSLGVNIDVTHSAPTPLGGTATAKATLVEVSGRKLSFKITAHDDAGEIGAASHTRVVVDRARFSAVLDARRDG